MERRKSLAIVMCTLGLASTIAACGTRARTTATLATVDLAVPRSAPADHFFALTTMESRRSERGTVLTIPGVLFEADRAELKTGPQRDLAALAAYLKKHPRQGVLIEGHTDSIGTADHNHELSLLRGTAVETFLLRNGVDPERIEVRGFGADRPIATNDTAEGRQQNRRVEIVILASDSV
jgi:outer membrane protein OmpA-like peptidoglycan-associated protein